MDTFITFGVVASTVLMMITSIYFMFFDKSGESFLAVIILVVILICFLLASAHNDDKLQHTNKCECIKESIDTTNYPHNDFMFCNCSNTAYICSIIPNNIR